MNGSALDSYTYSYDNLGNITVVNRSGDLPVYYTYDAQNQLVSVLEGDVVRILNTSGATVVAYSYDAWGKCTVTTGASNAIANANPIRYRGYYYDTDTGFYYLQSRYYDPAISDPRRT